MNSDRLKTLSIVLGYATLGLACSSPQRAIAPTPTVGTGEAPVAASTDGGVARRVTARSVDRVAQTSIPLLQRSSVTPDWSRFLMPASSPVGADMGTTRDVYRTAAPATVLITAGEGYGSGVIVSAQGDIVTNFHVVRHAEVVDLHRRVQVRLGRLGADGVMVVDGADREAWVMATSESADLAVVRLTTVPPGLVHVPVATENATPGDSVVALGNGSAGMMWTVRTCDVQVIGRPSQDSPMLMEICRQTDGVQVARCNSMRGQLERLYPNPVIQTNCQLSGGDSGGPLLDEHGAVVGINRAIASFAPSERATQWIYLHVHANDVRAILQRASSTRETAATAWLPVGEVVRTDTDLDGHFDQITVRSSDDQDEAVAVAHDYDQNALDGDVDSIIDRWNHHTLDVEAVEVSGVANDTRFGFHDTDDDGRLDTIIQSESDHSRGYRLSADGVAVADTSIAEGPDVLRPSLLPDQIRSLAERRSRAAEAGPLPAPLPAGLSEDGIFSDTDGDGHLDSVAIRRLGLGAEIFDTDQNSIGAATDRDAAREVVRSGHLDAEVSRVVVHGSTDEAIWTWYDRDNDGQFDLGFRSAGWDRVVEQAVLPAASGPTDQPGFEGRLALRTDLVNAGRDRWSMLLYGTPNADTALDGFPHPTQHSISPRYSKLSARRRIASASVSVTGQAFSSIVLDVDRDSFRGPRASNSGLPVNELVTGNHFDAEYALVVGRNAAWSWYDTNNDGTWDDVTVDFQRADGSNRRVRYQRGTDGHFSPATAYAGPLVNPALFQSAALQRGFAAFRELFRPEQG